MLPELSQQRRRRIIQMIHCLRYRNKQINLQKRESSNSNIIRLILLLKKGRVRMERTQPSNKMRILIYFNSHMVEIQEIKD
jgi:hypothetical protein